MRKIETTTMNWYRYAKNITASKHSSAIVALWLPKASAKRLALKRDELDAKGELEPVDQLHITIYYLGEADKLADKKPAIIKALKEFGATQKPIEATVSGYGIFAAEDGPRPLYASVDGVELPSFRECIVNCLRGVGVNPEQTHGFSPHISIAYLDPGAKLKEEVDVDTIPLKFNEFVLCWADQQTKFKLG